MQVPKASDDAKALFASVVPDDPRVVVKPMFGNLGAFVNGNMFAGLFTFALIAVPLSAAFSFATHPNTQQLFAGRLEEMGQGGYVTFWWIVTIFLLALPFLVGYAIARLSGRSLAIVGGIIALFVISILVLGQLFVF